LGSDPASATEPSVVVTATSLLGAALAISDFTSAVILLSEVTGCVLVVASCEL
jgi:hypothetical protein